MQGKFKSKVCCKQPKNMPYIGDWGGLTDQDQRSVSSFYFVNQRSVQQERPALLLPVPWKAWCVGLCKKSRLSCHGKQEKATASVVITSAPSTSSCPCSVTALHPQPGPHAHPPGPAEWVQGDCLDNADLHCPPPPARSQQFTSDFKDWVNCCSSTVTWTYWERCVHEGVTPH